MRRRSDDLRSARFLLRCGRRWAGGAHFSALGPIMDRPLTVDFIRWIVLLPLIGAAIDFLFGATLQRKFGKRIISVIGCGVVIGAFALAFSAFLRMLQFAPEHRFR